MANAPFRMRFKLSSSSISYATSNSGAFKIEHPQFAYSTNYLIYFKKYASYEVMDQDT